MPDEPRLIYWDACCFTYYTNADPQRLPTLEAVIDEVERSKGKIVIVTSVLSKVEVAFSVEERAARKLDEQEESKIAALWADASVVNLIEVYELIVDDARNLIRAAMVSHLSLQAADAIHLASAVRLGAAEFQTYDGKLLNPEYQRITGLTIREPYAAQPRLPGQ